MEKGFIKLFHKFDEWEWYDNPNVKVLFIHLLLKANIETKQWQGRTIKRGQLVTSIEKLAAANGLTTQQTRTALNNMRITKEIEIETTSRYSVITVKNYNLYQANNKPITKSFQGGNNKPNTKQITTTKDNNSNTSYINVSLSHSKEITKEEREILTNYVKKNKLAKSSVRAYVNAMIKNGDHIDILEQEQQKQLRKQQEATVPSPNGEGWDGVLTKLTPEDEQKIKELQAIIRRRRNDYNSKKD